MGRGRSGAPFWSPHDEGAPVGQNAASEARMNFLSAIFDTQQFAPHGQCLLWQSDLLILYTVSDTAIALAYFSIPLALAYFVFKRRDIAFRWVFVLFCIF